MFAGGARPRPTAPPVLPCSGLLGIRQIGRVMGVLNRIRVRLEGFPGAPGVATFYSLDTNTIVTSLQDLWTVLATAMPPDVTIQVDSAGDQIEETTGNIVGSWAHAAQGAIVGSGGANYAAPVGIAVTWLTDGIVAGQRVKGRTFVVPTSANIFDNQGRVPQGSLNGFQAAAEAFVAAQSASFVIWSRPFPGAAAVPPKPARALRLGSHSLVTASLVKGTAVVLRSRRD